MSDFFSNLLDRSLSRAPVLQRRRPSLFEPAPPGYGDGGAVGQSSVVVESEIVAEPQPTLRAGKFAPASLPAEMSDPEPRPFSRPRADQDLSSVRVDQQSVAAHAAEEFPLTHRPLADSAEPVAAPQDHRGNEPQPQIVPMTVVANANDAVPESRQSRIYREDAATIREAPRQDKNNADHPDGAVPASRSKSNPHAQTLPVAKATKTDHAASPMHERRQDNNSGGKPLVAVQATRREPDTRSKTSPVVKIDRKIDSAAPQREASHKLQVEPESIRSGQKNPVAAEVPALAPRSISLPHKSHSAPQQLAAPPAQPTIQVTIGRIEVRAAPAPAASARPARPAAAKLSLEDYLRSRSGGRS